MVVVVLPRRFFVYVKSVECKAHKGVAYGYPLFLIAKENDQKYALFIPGRYPTAYLL